MEEPASTRPRAAFRYPLWILLMAPLVVAALVLFAFPKLVTGDYLTIKVTKISNLNDGRIRVELETSLTSGTTLCQTKGGGPVYSFETGVARSKFDIIGTWPSNNFITVDVGINRDKLARHVDNPQDFLAIKQGSSYRVRPNQPLDLLRVRDRDGKKGVWRLEVIPSNRLGL